jgi:mRNA-degrading endonuclease toxin of MazEF toxin-antitoxin module
MKDFDNWNILKKEINNNFKKVFAHPREIWWFSSGVNVGMEIDGKNNLYERPGVVLKSHNEKTLTIIPISSNKEEKYYSFNFYYNEVEQSAILSQTKMIDTKRLTRKIGVLDEENFAKLNRKFLEYFKYESPIAGAISEAEAINADSITDTKILSNL